MIINWSGVQKMTLLRQSAAAECGLACVGMIANYHGYKTDLPTLRRSFEVSLKGATLSDLVKIGEEIGLGARALKCEPEDLGNLRLPAILHWNLSHFVVLKKIIGHNRVEIYDPAEGRLLLSLDDIDDQFTGVALELVPTASFKQRQEKSPVKLSSLVSFDKSMLKPVAQALLLSGFLQCFVLLAPFFIQLVIDEAILKGDTGLLFAISVGFGAIKLFEVAASVFRRVIFQLIGKLLSFDLKASMFHHLIRLPVSYFHGRGTGDIQQRFFSLNAISSFVVDGLIEAVVDGVLAITIGVILFTYSPLLGLVVVAFVLIYMVIRIAFLQFSKRLETDQQVALSEEATRFLETLTAMQTIKVAGVENERENLWRNRAAETINADIRVGNMRIAYDSLNDVIIGVSHIVIVYLAALATINGTMTIGMITAFLAYKIQFEQKLIDILNKWMTFRLLDVHLERVADIVLTERESDLTLPPIKQAVQGQITLRNVCFRYAPLEDDVLSHINFSIEQGEFVALAGPSGHGKSTLLRLITGTYLPTDGEITYDGKSMRSWGVKNIRRQLGVVMQDDVLLAGTIEENISMFSPEPNRDRCRWAAQAAEILEDIEQMPMGMNTLVGDMGSTLSGGQKQRVMLARALYRKPRILVLDEGTSQLDVETEMKINNTLKELKITRIAAAHRPDTLEKADRIIQVISGTVYENGEECKVPPLRIAKGTV